ncbi:MAG: methyltransferase domain-containing protein [Sediminibacterium sp.]|nr:methyltransferase domain-containing protein [Sediminibacterium sp.]
MKCFYELDLTKLDYSDIPDNFFDVILITHVIEHLHNGDEVLPLLIKKMKNNGVIYVEYPGQKSTKLPSMSGSLNFYDDPSHVRIYSIQELKKVFNNNNCSVINCGTRRNYYYIMALPFRLVYSLISGKKIKGNLFWDLLGFAEFLEVRKS